MSDIRIQGLSKYYIEPKSQTGIVALDNIHLQIPAKQITWIQGPSGCGKTTLLKILAGLLPPDEGQIYLGQVDITNQPANLRSMALVTQNYTLYPHMTIFDNIAYPLKQAKTPVEEIKQRVNDIASWFNLEILLSRKPKVLSGGQQQKVAIARALIKFPDIILMDEPFANLDTPNALHLLSIIRTLQAQTHATLVIVSHHIDHLTVSGDFLVEMDNGEMIRTTSIGDTDV
ncbi:ATP-binding cassette domain-containing protein [Acholeplasma vituli]|uniref:ATP-binding cassette domain-containing protein n=1 Tax=Paracholeplasma vituli TaxID=69473 RepID=A0ABT2PW25_9MOLU|nr:ATP-binding cassette domain-containing protein [Paracholeplasma vituli]MCU0105132.1 ATP-binding cassette domain-containing protein [Paracholeplasma vituli]